jgi:hypothetical protein
LHVTTRNAQHHEQFFAGTFDRVDPRATASENGISWIHLISWIQSKPRVAKGEERNELRMELASSA